MDTSIRRSPTAAPPAPRFEGAPAPAATPAPRTVQSTDQFDGMPGTHSPTRVPEEDVVLTPLERLAEVSRGLGRKRRLPEHFVELCAYAKKFGALPPTLSPADVHFGAPLLGRLLGNHVDIAGAHDGGSRVVPWTVNSERMMRALIKAGVNGIITDRPDLLRRVIEDFDAKGSHFLDPDGLVRADRFLLEGHRGGRSQRPENTLPSMEFGLDSLANALETDLVLTSDLVPMLTHDPQLKPEKARRLDGKRIEHPPRIRDCTRGQLQSDYALDRKLDRFPNQQNDLSLSPVACAYAKARALAHPYVMPALEQFFDFARFYADYYRSGAGRNEPNAALRARNAENVRFNLELKIDGKETLPPDQVAKATVDLVRAHGLESRCIVQSFDLDVLQAMLRLAPTIQTALLTK